MGAGIAKQIKEQFPEAYQADLKTTKGDFLKMGTYSFAEIKRNSVSFFVYNLYGQFLVGKSQQTNYSALTSCFKKLKSDVGNKNYRFGIPYKIGCGLAGGDWKIVEKIIENELNGEDVSLVNLGY